MRILVAFALSQFLATCAGVAFDSSQQQLSFLGVVARGGAKANTDHHDPEKATNTILSSIARVERTVQKAVEDEIHTLFHDLDEDKKAEIVTKAQKAVKQGTAKVKKEVDDHAHPSKYPFESSKKETTAVDHKDNRILHAVEEAERAVLHAIQYEFNSLFHEMDHHETTETVKEGVKIGVKKATEKVEKVHQHRRDWMTNQVVDIQDYMEHDLE